MRRLRAILAPLEVSLLAVDYGGTWNVSLETDAGSGAPIFVLKQSGETISGTCSGALGDGQMSESINAKIQWGKYTARGFRNKRDLQTAIYFHCGGLDMAPSCH
ncbi:MAG: hypothetical protein ACE141_16865 [Bryobacteraceae bacterium]